MRGRPRRIQRLWGTMNLRITGIVMEPETLIFSLTLPFRAVPWTPSRTTRWKGTYKPKRLRQWQATVAQYARIKWGNCEPYNGPVTIWCRFEFAKGPFPDGDNCQKALIDSLQSIVIENDRQVVRTTVERIRV